MSEIPRARAYNVVHCQGNAAVCRIDDGKVVISVPWSQDPARWADGEGRFIADALDAEAARAEAAEAEVLTERDKRALVLRLLGEDQAERQAAEAEVARLREQVEQHTDGWRRFGQPDTTYTNPAEWMAERVEASARAHRGTALHWQQHGADGSAEVEQRLADELTELAAVLRRLQHGTPLSEAMQPVLDAHGMMWDPGHE